MLIQLILFNPPVLKMYIHPDITDISVNNLSKMQILSLLCASSWNELCKNTQNTHMHIPSMHLEISITSCTSPCVWWTTSIVNFWSAFSIFLLPLHNNSSTATNPIPTSININLMVKCYVYNSFFCLFVFLGPHPKHMDMPRLGVESELQLLAYTTAIAMPDPRHVFDLHHSSLQCEFLNPLSKTRD